MIKKLRSEMKQKCKEVEDEANELHEIVKRKRSIIIKDTEPTKHRKPKLEEE